MDQTLLFLFVILGASLLFFWKLILPIYRTLYFNLFQYRFSKNLFTHPQFSNFAPSTSSNPSYQTRVLNDKIVTQLNQDTDVIIIGSGISCLVTACLLTRTGKKVVMLEQHDRLGGLCHTFTVDGKYEFDSGFHYVGQLGKHQFLYELFCQCCDANLQFEPMDSHFDKILFSKNKKEYSIVATRQAMQTYLQQQFPQQSKEIEQFLDLIDRVERVSKQAMEALLTPFPIGTILRHTLYKSTVKEYFHFSDTTLTTVLEQYFPSNIELRQLFGYVSCNMGVAPQEIPFTMFCFVWNHLIETGTYYPTGGPQILANQMIQFVESHGGACFLKSKVTEILINEDKAIGVTVQRSNSSQHFQLFAPMIISGAGYYQTIHNLLPRQLSCYNQLVKEYLEPTYMKPSLGHMFIFLVLNGDKQELQLKNQNYWILNEQTEHAYDDYLSSQGQLRLDDKVDIPLLGVLSKSMKESVHEKDTEHTICILFLSKFDWFQFEEEKTENSAPTKRSEEYEEKKSQLCQRALDLVLEHFPIWKNKIKSMNFGSPLTTKYYVNRQFGESYGVQLTKERILKDPHYCQCQLLQGAVRNLWMVGSDLGASGIVGSSISALWCASSILKRNVYQDLLDSIELQKKQQ